MYNEVVSRHVGSSGEVLLLIPIKAGFAPISELVLSYSTRLKMLLDTLYEIRARKTQRGFPETQGPVERLETLFRVQWTVLESQQSFEDTRQVNEPQLLVSAHYDRTWEDYFHRLRAETGPLLDLIFSHCRGYEGHSTKDAYERFIGWIREHQRPDNFLFAALPNVTSDDTRCLMELVRLTRRSNGAPCILSKRDASIFQLQRPTPTTATEAITPLEKAQSAFRSIHSLAELRDRLFSNAVELDARTGFELYDDALGSVFGNEPDVAELVGGARLYPPPLDPTGRVSDPVGWARGLLDRSRQQLAPRPASQLELTGVQSNILRGARVSGNVSYRYGCVLLVACRDRAAWAALLRRMLNEVTTEYVSQDVPISDTQPQHIVNFALSYAGLERLGLDEPVLAEFPVEFRQGLEARAALLGDSHLNDPYYWQQPKANGGWHASERIHLNAVDAMITLLSASDDFTGGSWPAAQLGAWDLADAGVRVLHVQTLDRGPDGRDHFGFADGLSQPVFDLALPPRSQQEPKGSAPVRVPPGEALLGHVNRTGQVALCASDKKRPTYPLFANGTYLVVRKLRQNVEAFEKWSDRNIDALLADALLPSNDVTQMTRDALKAKLHAKLIGRDPGGTPLSELGGSGEQFDFKNDPLGVACPFHAHIRRANPREDRRVAAPSRDATPEQKIPRIVRRSMPYDDGDERGLFFMAYSASLADQYEVIQRWLNGGNSTNILSAQNDLLTAPNCEDPFPHWIHLSATPGLPPEPRALAPRNGVPFVELRWGLYLFVPSQGGIEWLADRAEKQPSTYDREAAEALRTAALHAWQDAVGTRAPEPARSSFSEIEWSVPTPYEPSVARGQARIRELDALPLEDARLAWKKLIEEPAAADSKLGREVEDVWAAIRAEPLGIKNTPHHVLVATELGARYVLGDRGRTFSVCEYATRLTATSGPHYLGLDVDSAGQQDIGYAEFARTPNEYFDSLEANAFEDALRHARAILAEPGSLQREYAIARRVRNGVSLRDLSRATIGRLCQDWFDLQPLHTPGTAVPTDPGAIARTLDLFLVCSRNAFQHAPEGKVKEQAQLAGQRIRAQVYPQGGGLAGLGAALRADTTYLAGRADRDERIRQAVIGAVVGFAPPAHGTVLRVLDQWIENGQFWFIQQQLNGMLPSQIDSSPQLRGLLAEAMRRTPSPPILYRKTARALQLGHEQIEAGKQVIVGLSSAFTDAAALGYDAPEAWLFGGKHGGGQTSDPPHGCPAREVGTRAMLGILAALCAQRDVKRESRGTISYAAF